MQQAVNLFDKLVVVIIIVTVALIVAAILVSPRRWYTVLELALGLLLGVVITKVIVTQLEKLLLDSIKKEGVVAVANSIVTSAVDKLAAFFVWLIVVAVVVAVAAVFGTRPKLDGLRRPRRRQAVPRVVRPVRAAHPGWLSGSPSIWTSCKSSASASRSW